MTIAMMVAMGATDAQENVDIWNLLHLDALIVR